MSVDNGLAIIYILYSPFLSPLLGCINTLFSRRGQMVILES
jgi:hypothetical protein